MGIKTGPEYLESLRDGRDVWMGGQRVRDVTTEPGLARGARTLAEFIDRQQDAALLDTLTFVEEENEEEERYPMAFLLPRTPEDVRRRGAAFYEWASGAVSPGPGCCDFRLRQPAGALRTVLLRAAACHGVHLLRSLQQR